ncbi:MAG: hypothetical protein Ta2D_02970 [Rickettsiales bacterium]|nr:MAG: hypothetical protein Ta2D_02970 [Rickettsiales bacterium]
MTILKNYTYNFALENSYNLPIIAGIDEVGRGCLCANVFASCVVITQQNNIPNGITDSKKIAENNREKIFEEIIKNETILYGIGESSVEEIDKYNIREATKLAMQRSYENLKEKYGIKPDLVLVDGNFVPKIDTRAEFIIKGDAKSVSIATASIIAKVSRDRVLRELDIKYPEYKWGKNKGYGTKEHIEAIKKYGMTDEHRKTFCKKFNYMFLL